MHRLWFTLTGAASVGKSTALGRVHDLFSDLNRVNEQMQYVNYPTVICLPESARGVIAGGLKPGMPGFQQKVTQVQTMQEDMLSRLPIEDFVVIADRTLLDVYAYSLCYGEQPPFGLDELQAWMDRYDHVFLFDVKDTVHRHDGIRDIEGSPAREKIQEELLRTIDLCNVPYTIIDNHIAQRHIPVCQYIRETIDREYMGEDTQMRAPISFDDHGKAVPLGEFSSN